MGRRKGSTLNPDHKRKIAESARRNRDEKSRKNQRREHDERRRFVALFSPNNSTNNTTANKNSVANSESDPVSTPNGSNGSLNDASFPPVQEQSFVDGSLNAALPRVVNPNEIDANLDAPAFGDPDPDDVDYLDEEENDEEEEAVGIMPTYIKGIQEQTSR